MTFFCKPDQFSLQKDAADTIKQHLHFSYPDGQKAVNGLSFLVHHGDSVGIIGANGAGKSTLLMLLTGLLQADSGEVIVGDVRLTKKTLLMIRERVGMVLQDPEDQLFMPTIYEDVAFGPRNFGLDEGEVGARVKKALEVVGITHLKDRAPFRLSGGENARQPLHPYCPCSLTY